MLEAHNLRLRQELDTLKYAALEYEGDIRDSVRDAFIKFDSRQLETMIDITCKHLRQHREHLMAASIKQFKTTSWHC